MAIGEPDRMAMQVASYDMVRTSASATALGGQAPTGVGPAVRATLLGDGHHWPHGATRPDLATQPPPGQALCTGVREELQQIKVNLTSARGGGRTIKRTLVVHSSYAKLWQNANQQYKFLQATPIHVIPLSFAIPPPATNHALPSQPPLIQTQSILPVPLPLPVQISQLQRKLWRLAQM